MAVSQEEILETISGMTVMEVVDLISAMEEKFGVTAAAAVANNISGISRTTIRPSIVSGRKTCG